MRRICFIIVMSAVALIAPLRTDARDPTRQLPGGQSGWHTVVIPEPALAEPGRVAWGKLTVTPHDPRVVPSEPVQQPAARPTGSLPPPRALVGPAHLLAGLASFYWQEQMTSSGERFDKQGLTAAHRTLPFGSRVRVTHVASGRSVVVRINDRGPFKPGRVIDLSLAAAEQIGMTGQGVAHVRIDVIR